MHQPPPGPALLEAALGRAQRLAGLSPPEEEEEEEEEVVPSATAGSTPWGGGGMCGSD